MPTITITASKDRRRAGLSFRRGQPVMLDVADLTDAQLAALRADPMLTIEGEAAKVAKGGKGVMTRKPSAAAKRAAKMIQTGTEK